MILLKMQIKKHDYSTIGMYNKSFSKHLQI